MQTSLAIAIVRFWCAAGENLKYLPPPCGGPLLENGLDRPENRYGRYGLLVFPAFPYLPWGSMAPALKIFFSCSLGGGGGRYFSVPRKPSKDA